MKKVKTLLFSLLLCSFIFVIVGCGNKGNNGGGGGGGETPTPTVNLTYAEWGDQVVAQKMLDAFMDKHPNIKVTLDTSITGTGKAFTTNLIAAAQANMLPDVFVTDNVPSVIENGLVRDISEYWDADNDAKLVYPNIANTAVYKNAEGKQVRLAAPSYQFIKGILVNTTLLKNLGIDIPEYDWTFDDFYAISKQVQKAGTIGNFPVHAVNGYNGTVDFEKAMTAQAGVGLGYDSWNGNAFDYTNPEWIKYRKLTEEFYDTKLLEQLTAEEKEQFYGSPDAWPFKEGHVAFGFEGSWNVISVLDEFAAKGQDVEFYPYPAGKEAKEAVILDYMCVSSLTTYPKEAYELLKWMSFGREGWLARLEIMKESGTGLDRYPVAEYPEVWENINTYMNGLNEVKNYSGLIYCIQNIKNGAPDCDKWLPGYMDFWNYINDTAEEEGWYDKEAEQLAREWTVLVNQYVDEAYKKLGLSK